MAKRRREGVCHLCGEFGPLSFEHVPPAAAFNNGPVIGSPIGTMLEDGFEAPARGKINQRGAGDYTLCERCNNRTGSWYAHEFSRWCRQGTDVLVRSGFKPRLIYLHYVFPLRILKQIITMCFSINTPRWREKHYELEQFVLDRDRRWLHDRYRVFAYYNVDGCYRRVGNSMAMINLKKSTRSIQVTEISHTPFGYVVAVDGTHPDSRLCEITHFQRYEYDEFEVAPLHLPILPTHLPIPLDYRSASEINEQAERSVRLDDAT
jgi:hypothetical protein